MSNHLILGTAGHIDHGKTALVRALTGVDTDRLPEEKTRGITIDIGFAQLSVGEFEVGVVDVPGHERFIKNMLAGASGIDLALLLVAADDSVMPQTREHLEILRLLGLRHGVIAISKSDLASDDTWLELVEEEIRELVEGTFLEGAAIVRTSAQTGVGIDQLREELLKACLQVKQRRRNDLFRLAADRTFAVAGHGTVITGSVWYGSAKVGDEVEWVRNNKILRIRGIQNHDQQADQISQSQRAAINLGGVHHSEMVRGDEIATPGFLKPSRIFSVWLDVLKSSPRPIKHRSTVRLHIGTAERIATVSLLETNQLKPGMTGKAQLFLDESAVAVWGQPFVVRSESPMITLGGGQVLQPIAQRMRRRLVESIAALDALRSEDAANRALTAIRFYGTDAWTPKDLARDAGISLEETSAVIDDLVQRGELVELVLSKTRTRLVAIDAIAQLESQVLGVLQRLHDANPLHAGIQRERVIAGLDYLGNELLAGALIHRLTDAKRIISDGRLIARSDFKPQLSNSERRFRKKILELYLAGGFQPPDVPELQKSPDAKGLAVQQIVELCAAEGRLVHMGGTIYLDVSFEEELKKRVVDVLKEKPGLTVAEIRDLLGTTRKFALPICEYLDRTGITRREGDLRVPGEALALANER